MTVMTETSQHSLVEPILAEFRTEAATPRRVLERIPSDKLGWKPHAKSMTIGQLGWHIAANPGRISRLAQGDSFDLAQADFRVPSDKSLNEILAAHEESVREAEQFLQGLSDEQATANWRLLRNGVEVFCRPRIGVVRSIMLNHWYHHRGQLSVYLRLLNVPVPVIYGRSADEDPFA